MGVGEGVGVGVEVEVEVEVENNLVNIFTKFFSFTFNSQGTNLMKQKTVAFSRALSIFLTKNQHFSNYIL